MVQFKEGKLPKNSEDRLKYLYKFQETLRIYHNNKASQTKEGELTLKEFRKFQQGWFNERNQLICVEIAKCKSQLTEKEKESLLQDGSIKNKELYKKDKNIKIDINDIEV